MDDRQIDDDDVERLQQLFGDLHTTEKVRIIWDSDRSSDDVSIVGKRRLDRYHNTERNPDVDLRVKTDERVGDIVVRSRNSRYGHDTWWVYSTGSRHSNRSPRIGELVDVERVGDDA